MWDVAGLKSQVEQTVLKHGHERNISAALCYHFIDKMGTYTTSKDCRIRLQS